MMEVKVGRTWQPYNKSVSTQWLRTALRVLSLLENGSLAGFRNVVLHPPPPKKKIGSSQSPKKADYVSRSHNILTTIQANSWTKSAPNPSLSQTDFTHDYYMNQNTHKIWYQNCRTYLAPSVSKSLHMIGGPKARKARILMTHCV